MHTLNPRVLKNLITKYISPFIVEDRVVIDKWTSRTAVHPAPGVIEPDGKPEKIMRLGDRWKAGYDDTRFFEATVTVPEHFAGRKVYLCIDFGGEILVRLDGKIVGAVSSRENSGWVGRNEILFPQPFAGGETLNIELEAAVDCGGFCNHALAGEKWMEYTMKTAELQLINEETEAFYFDITCAWDVKEHTSDPVTAKRLYNAIDTAAHVPDYDAGKERFYADVPKARQALREALDRIPYAVPGGVVLTGHSHLDVAWLWTVNEITRKCARTFANNLALMDAYPDFKFTQSQAAVYYYIKEYYPELFPKIQEKVKSGQWEITGNTWVEADTNLASGESLIRQLLYGREFFLKEFGVCSDIYWLPDCFGFTAALPQIINRSGMKYFFTSKLQNNDTNEFPMSVFRWRSHSGHEVLAYMQKIGYGGEADARYITAVRERNSQNDLVDLTMGNFGYGDGGGGCTYNMVERMRRYREIPGMPETRIGTAAEFFASAEAAKDELPVWDGEMYYENHRGTFTSQAFVKENNRRGEYLLRRAELLSVLTGDYEKEELEALWRILLTNQFHDILPGSSIHEVYENTRKEYADLHSRGEALVKRQLNKLTTAYAGDNTVAVWNFLPWAVTDAVDVQVPKGFTGVFDKSGRAMRSSVKEAEDHNVLTFIAEDVPAVGCRIYNLSNFELCVQTVTVEKDRLENEFLRVMLDASGAITSVYDKENEREILAGGGNRLSISHDKPVHESAWNLESDYQLHMDYLNAAGVTVAESSAVRGAVRVEYEYHDSKITQEIALNAGARHLDFITHVDWKEREKVLKAEFPLALRARYSAFEVAHGALERPTFANNSFEQAMFECCAHKWVDLGESDYGVSLLNNCKYGHDVRGNLMRITLMRGPVLPDRTGDICEQDFVYSLFPHKGSWCDAGTVKEAQRLNEPLRAQYYARGEEKGRAHSWLSLDNDGVVLDAVKQAQDGEGVIVRVYEALRRHTAATLTLPAPVQAAFACNLMEENERPLPADGRTLRFEIAPFEVKTFRFVF